MSTEATVTTTISDTLRLGTRSHMGGDLRTSHLGQEVTLFGWVDSRRDHGGVIFVDLRDRTGLVQIVFEPETSPEAHQAADRLRGEYAVGIRGFVRARGEGLANPRLATGEIEVAVRQLEVYNAARPLPFPLDDDGVDENLRLTHRYLELRGKRLTGALAARHRIMQQMRRYLDDRGFLEIETPILTKSTPEGARDYLVPSRVHPGEFFALPQSPQIFKQILMVGGQDRYFQIARCFRDEDLRADRQPEFTQLDCELSWTSQDQILELFEGLMAHLIHASVGANFSAPIPRMSWLDAMNRYGSDKPDTRFGLELCDLTDATRGCSFQVFSGAPVVKGLRVPGGAQRISRSQIDALTDFVRKFGAKGLAYVKVGDPSGPVAKNLAEAELATIVAAAAAEPGDLLFFGAGEWGQVVDVLGRLRLKLGQDLGLIPQGLWNLLWVVDFPMFEYDATEGRLYAVHHPFTSARPSDLPVLARWAAHLDEGGTLTPEAIAELTAVKANAYDMVLNGVELGGGSIRIHQAEVQQQAFRLLGLTPDEIKTKFGFMIEAFTYGTPPHGGIAFGLDRLCMLLSGVPAIRDVIAFPKTQQARDLMAAAPGGVDDKQLKELHVRTVVEG